MSLFRSIGAFVASVTLAIAADVKRVAPVEAAKLVSDGKAVLVDVREPAEWASIGVAAPAVLLPKSDYDGAQQLWKKFLAGVGDKQIILYCRSGARAKTVGAALMAKGFNVANAGGLREWIDAGLPVRKIER